MFEIRNIGWWYWLATLVLLAGGLAGWPSGIDLATALCAVQVVHFAIRTGSPTSFPVQVRAAYLDLLVAGNWPPLAFVHWVQLAGTSATVVFGYCPLARMLSLLPWNRREPFTVNLVRRVFLSRPVRGSIVEQLAAQQLVMAERMAA